MSPHVTLNPKAIGRTRRVLMIGIAGASLAAAFDAPARAETITVGASRDGTIIEAPVGEWSLGEAWHIYTGRTGPNGGNTLRRGLIHFPVDAIPAGSTITSVKLRLYMSKGQTGTQNVSLKRCTSDWGEGSSFAFGGAGSPPMRNDVTWTKRFYPGMTWNTPGGDFVSTASVTIPVGGIAWYTFGSTPGLVADVQQWVNGVEPNYGWGVIGNESGPTKTMRRFESHDTTSVAWRPTLEIVFTPPAVPGDLNGDGFVDGDDLAVVLGSWGNCAECVADVNDDGVVDGSDLTVVLGQWNPA